MIHALVDLLLEGVGGVVLVTYFLALYERLNEPKGRPRIPVPRALWGMAMEYAAAVANVVLFGSGFIDLDPWLGGREGPPVLLLHGYGMNRACLFLLQFRIARAGYRARTLNLLPPYGDIRRLAGQAAKAIEGLSQAHGGAPVAVVGHSMGGLVLREACRTSPKPLPVGTLVTLGTPHGGTKMAVFGLGAAAPMMRPESPFLADLKGSPPPPVACHAFWSMTDNLVLPARAGAWPGASEHVFDHLGHLTLLLSGEVARGVIEALPPASRAG